MDIQYDGKEQAYIEWEQISGSFKRAWIQKKSDVEKDWAGTGRYLNVVRCNSKGHPGGNPTDFPIFDATLTDEKILKAFVSSVNAITGCVSPGQVAVCHTIIITSQPHADIPINE